MKDCFGYYLNDGKMKDCFGYYLNDEECDECNTKVACHIKSVDDEDEDCD